MLGKDRLLQCELRCTYIKHYQKVLSHLDRLNKILHLVAIMAILPQDPHILGHLLTKSVVHFQK